ncbi:aspartate dehydrogenase [Pseudaestuariivita sp.]|uniref:aspartate dehydrogenase n=1 Tax=Pseudaestuariivita sp. TaxID=2211669 RepID=UPI0040587BAB
MRLILIGKGAIARHVTAAAEARGWRIAAVLVRADTAELAPGWVTEVADLPPADVVVDCAGHSALRGYGAAILRGGTALVTVSLGALADDALYTDLKAAAEAGGTQLHLASGAIGALDALRAARTGKLDRVQYIGRKPPQGWKGSPAEERLDLDALGDTPATHFEGTARDAALAYPKNANVAAAVALSGVGFDATQVTLIADPTRTANIHEIHASGDFGTLSFQVAGNALPDAPRSSALAAMSVVARLEALAAPVQL